MTDDKWQRVRETFDSALRRQPEDRLKFVREVCGNDQTLLAEVESLLSSLDTAESFWKRPPLPKPPRLRQKRKYWKAEDVSYITE